MFYPHLEPLNRNFTSTTPSTTLKHLPKLDPKSAPGICGIESEIFVYCANVLAIPLTNLFNVCIESNCVPDEWKISYITPLYKGKGSKSSPDNLTYFCITTNR